MGTGNARILIYMEKFSYDKRVIPFERAKFNLGLQGRILLMTE